MSRRNVELDERKYLMGRGVVTEMQSNMGEKNQGGSSFLEMRN